MSQQTGSRSPVPTTASQPAASDGARTPDQIAADLTATRGQLAETIDQLVERVHPRALALRGVESAKSSVVDADGQPRTGRIVTVAVGASGVVVALVLLRTVVRRGGNRRKR